MADLVHCHTNGQREYAVPQRDEGVDARQPDQHVERGRLVGRDIGHQGSFPDEQRHDRYHDDEAYRLAQVAEAMPEPLWLSEEIDELLAPPGPPHDEPVPRAHVEPLEHLAAVEVGYQGDVPDDNGDNNEDDQKVVHSRPRAALTFSHY